MCTYLYISACRNSLGMLVTAMYFPSFASITHVIILSKDRVGELVSALVVYSCCDFPFAHPLTLMLLSRFSFKNIKYLRAFFLGLWNVSSFFLGRSTCFSCNWFSSFTSASFPLCQLSLRPLKFSFVSLVHEHVVWQIFIYYLVRQGHLAIKAIPPLFLDQCSPGQYSFLVLYWYRWLLHRLLQGILSLRICCHQHSISFFVLFCQFGIQTINIFHVRLSWCCLALLFCSVSSVSTPVTCPVCIGVSVSSSFSSTHVISILLLYGHVSSVSVYGSCV